MLEQKTPSWRAGDCLFVGWCFEPRAGGCLLVGWCFEPRAGDCFLVGVLSPELEIVCFLVGVLSSELESPLDQRRHHVNVMSYSSITDDVLYPGSTLASHKKAYLPKICTVCC